MSFFKCKSSATFRLSMLPCNDAPIENNKPNVMISIEIQSFVILEKNLLRVVVAIASGYDPTV